MDHLAWDGIVAVEIGYDQRQDVAMLFADQVTQSKAFIAILAATTVLPCSKGENDRFGSKKPLGSEWDCR